MLVEKLCREEEIGFVDLWGSFFGRADMYIKDWLHLSGKVAAVFAHSSSRQWHGYHEFFFGSNH